MEAAARNSSDRRQTIFHGSVPSAILPDRTPRGEAPIQQKIDMRV